MKFYIAGPMTGRTHYNVDAFRAAAELLIAEGHEALTPFNANSEVWRRHYGRPFDPFSDVCDYGDPILREMLAEDVKLLMSADAILLLKGYEHSKGALAELHLANLAGLEVYVEVGPAAIAGPWKRPTTILEGPSAPVVASREPETVLQEAQRLVHGDRQASYGHPYDDYVCTSRMWEAYLGLAPGFIGPRRAADMMVLVKLSRSSRHYKRDNYVDMAGYAECGEMIHEREAEVWTAEKEKPGVKAA